MLLAAESDVQFRYSARTLEPGARGDFVWPPPADDPCGCTIVVLDADAGLDVRPRTPVSVDERDEAFPDIDLETALDAFADLHTSASVPSASAPVPTRAAHDDVRAATRSRGAARVAVALGIGASLALAPPAGQPHVFETRPVAVPAPARSEAPVAATPRGVVTADPVRVAPVPVATAAAGKVVPRDEDRIRTTLSELQSAYALLDADAARAVWPSVDVDALARAFVDLKSQELRFDRCDVTVDGARARAACIGEAVYVPRARTTASSSATRVWTFELTRMHERWTIATGRAS